jgi:signal transduction histidine kinase
MTGMPETPLDYKSYLILYVDDEKENLEAFADEFEDYFTILVANSGPEALKVLEEKTVSLVLVDQRMPDMSGVKVLEEISKRDPRAIRILITAYADIEVVIEAINKGNVYRYIKKPWEHEDVRTEIMRVLEHYHTERERERLQAERIQNMRKMVRSNRLAAVGTMVSGMVHEIRNPMVAIQTFFQLLPKKMDDKEFIKRYLTIAQGEADRIEHLLENMLSFARPARPVLRPCNLNELVERMVQLLEFQARRRNIKIQSSRDESTVLALADPSQIMQVIQNLGMNAIQAMGHGGTLSLRTFFVQRADGDEYVGLETRDTGPGIDKQTLEKIFDPFFTTRDEGTGLGLSITYQIINEHNGILEVESEPGKGASFSFYLPACGTELKEKGYADSYTEKEEVQVLR